MQPADLLAIIGQGESSSLEFKRDDCRPEQFAREMVAMMNLRGGRILLGVEDDGRISGLRRTDTETWVMNIASTVLHPRVVPHYEVVTIEDGRQVAVVSFAEGPGKPYALRSDGREEVWIRAGTTNRRATREEWTRLLAAGGLLHPEKMPVSGASLDAMDRARLDEYLRMVLQDPEVPDSDDSWVRRLVQLGFMVRTDYAGPLCTVAGVLLFAYRPRQLLPQAGLRVIAYPGDDKSDEVLLDTLLDGPLAGRTRRTVSGQLDEVEPGLIQRCVTALEPIIHRQDLSVGLDLQRHRRWLYPVAVLRELLVNAFAHRDWTRVGDVVVTVYSNRLEVASPGSLPNSLSVDQMLGGQRVARNPIINDVLRDYGYSDARGMGFRRKVVPLLRESSGRSPAVEVSDDFVRVVGWAPTSDAVDGVS